MGPDDPLRGVAGGGLTWVLTAATDSLNRDGHLLVTVRGLVLARQAPVPPAPQGTNPFPDFWAIVSCQSIGAGDTATVANIGTGDFTAGKLGLQDRCPGGLPHPCITPIVFVIGPTRVDAWFAATGG